MKTLTHRAALSRGRHHLDDATENITFDEFRWALEEAWWGAAHVLNAMARAPRATLELGPRGELPGGRSLRPLERAARRLSRDLAPARRLEALRDEAVAHSGDIARGSALAERIVAEVWAVWRLHDLVAGRLAPVAGPSVDRRSALRLLGMSALLPACSPREPEGIQPRQEPPVTVSAQGPTSSAPGASADDPTTTSAATVRRVEPLPGMQWPTHDPFLFCAHHVDDYPEGDGAMGPAASLDGRLLGRDFDGKDGWNMYHGRAIPGFPRHPHRGFETVTVVRRGRLDHADSMGAAARYGGGDVQWLTAGGGIQHAEMFPLLRADARNPLELFQIWLNLPAASKMVAPHFTMLWSEDIPRVSAPDAEGRDVEVTISAGRLGEHVPPAPPPDSWASRPEADVAIWNVKMAPGARFTLPEVAEGTERSLYTHVGAGLTAGGTRVDHAHRAILEGHGAIELVAGSEVTEVLLLQGRPIGEPVARRGPFVMSSQDEIRQAYEDYQATGFGGWPWTDDGPVHDETRDRFARHIDGREEEPPA